MTQPHALPLREAHFALSIEPAGTLEPGGRAVLRYHARNAAAVASPPARVHFLLPAELTAEGSAIECALPALGPGSAQTVALPVTVASPLPSGAVVSVQAALLVDGREPLGSNVVRAAIFSRPRLDGPQTAIVLRRGARPDEIVMEATVVNDGNAAASGVRLTLPPPDGTRLTAGTGSVHELGTIDAGEGRTVAVGLTLEAPVADRVIAADARVAHDDGIESALHPGAPLELSADCGFPAIELDERGRRLRVRVTVANAGWADARETAVVFVWPAGYRLADGSLEVNGGIPARAAARDAWCTARVRPGSADVSIARIARRSDCVVTCELIAGPKAAGGELRVTVAGSGGERDARAELPVPPSADLRLHAVAQPAVPIDAGESARIEFDVANVDDRAQTYDLDVVPAARVTIAGRAYSGGGIVLPAGSVQRITADLDVSPLAADGERVEVRCSVRTATGAVQHARAHVGVRRRVRIDASRWFHADGEARVELRNCAGGFARNVRFEFDCGEILDAGDVAPFTTVALPLGDLAPATIARGGRVTVRGECAARLAPVPFGSPDAFPGTIAFEAAPLAAAGVALPLLLRVELSADVAALRVQVRDDAALVPLAGSTRVNGHAVADPHGRLLYDGGLVVRGLSAGTELQVGWSVLPGAALTEGACLEPALELDADGCTLAYRAEPIAVMAQTPFDARPDTLPFHVDGVALPIAPECARPYARESPPAAPYVPEPAIEPRAQSPVPKFTLRLDAERCAALGRLLRGAVMPGFVSHVFSLRALFSDGAACADPAVLEALALERDALRAVLDRLYVKVRIPEYDIIASDCEDVTARRSIAALLAACGLDGEADGLDAEPLGSPRALSAVARFLPDTRGEGEIGDRIAAYVDVLRDELRGAQASALFAFEERLANGFEARLDDARDRVLAALERTLGAAV